MASAAGGAMPPGLAIRVLIACKTLALLSLCGMDPFTTFNKNTPNDSRGRPSIWHGREKEQCDGERKRMVFDRGGRSGPRT